MAKDRLLISAMAEKCRDTIESAKRGTRDLPEGLQPPHLLWMCERIQQNAEDWPVTRLHRWLGFLQGGLMANRMLDLDGAKAMFDDAKNAYGAGGDDQDLIDHLDPNNPFKMDIGGEG